MRNECSIRGARLFRRAALPAAVSALAALVLLLPPWPAAACQVPVFRYALERWAPDAYEVLILHRGPLTAAEAELAKRLELAAGDTGKPANLQVVRVDLAARSKDPVTEMLKKQHPGLKAPWLVLKYPNAPADARPAWTGPLSAESVAAVVDSPGRREIVRRLVGGHSAVWVLLESGHKDQDNAAAAMLERELEKNSKMLKLPDPEVLQQDEFYKPDTKVALRVEFSLLRLKHNDVAEAVLRAMLVGSEPDLKDFDAPLAVPIFGRGRAAFTLVGKGIMPEEINKNCQFVIGRCSCQVKAENPGVDLLIAADWDKLVGSRAITESPPAELSGIGVLLSDPDPAPPAARAKPERAGEKLDGQRPAATRPASPQGPPDAAKKPQAGPALPERPSAAATDSHPVSSPENRHMTAHLFAGHLTHWLLGLLGAGLIAAGVLLGMARR